jgi:hypothetical protein
MATMATEASSLKTFIERTKRILAPLTDEVDNKTAVVTIRYALQTVGADLEKLRSFVNAIYDKITPHHDCSAKLLVNLMKNTPSNISTLVRNRKNKGICLEGGNLVR